MDKRLKPVDPAESLKERQALYAALRDGSLSLPDAVKRLRRLSKLTQPEFAAHRGISVQALRQIESGRGNPTIETLNKIVEVFGLQVGFVPRRRGTQVAKRTPIGN
jgi:DNA-binding XRE family transcriptional regulator